MSERYLDRDGVYDTAINDYASTSAIVYKLNKISELETKLAESEADKKALICDYESRITKEQELMSWLEHNNEELKQQLAEKDKTIETILKENEELLKNHNVYTWGDEIQQDKFYAITGEALEFLMSNQAKISFCIKQLEKAKEFSVNVYGIEHAEEVIEEYIDNQIAELTHQEDKGE